MILPEKYNNRFLKCPENLHFQITSSASTPKIWVIGFLGVSIFFSISFHQSGIEYVFGTIWMYPYADEDRPEVRIIISMANMIVYLLIFRG